MSLLASVLASAGEGASQLPFYVAGIGLALFAVAVSAVGIRRPGFLHSQGLARGLMALSVVLVVLVMVTSVVTAE